jgi:hypothetical protein
MRQANDREGRPKLNDEQIDAELRQWLEQGLGSSNAGFWREDGEYQPVEQVYIGDRHLCDLTIENGEVLLVFAPSLSSTSAIRVRADHLTRFIDVLKMAIVNWEAGRKKALEEANDACENE